MGSVSDPETFYPCDSGDRSYDRSGRRRQPRGAGGKTSGDAEDAGARARRGGELVFAHGCGTGARTRPVECVSFLENLLPVRKSRAKFLGRYFNYRTVTSYIDW